MRIIDWSSDVCSSDRPGLVPIRVLEGGTASAGPQGLRCFALGCDAVHFRADDGGIAGRALEKRLDHDRAFWKRAVSVAVMEVLRLPAFHPAIPQDDRAFDEDISGLPAISARVHADCAADRSGNAPQKFHAGNARVPRSARYEIGRAHV